MAPEGQAATHAAFVQWLHVRGRWKKASRSTPKSWPRSSGVSASRLGSLAAYSFEPERSSSQFGPDLGTMSLPVTSDTGRAVGCTSDSAASKRSRYRYVQGS